MRRTITTKFLCCALLLTGCATQLQEPPTQEEVLEDALPETTEIRAEWAAPADDAGDVDDDWLATFEDPQLEALVAEALDTQNPNLRILSAQVDRATAAARLAGAALKPTVALGGDLSGTTGPSAVEQESAAGGIGVSWEADVWGRVQAGVNAAEESLRATVADFEFARQSLIAGVAKSWYLATELRLQAESRKNSRSARCRCRTCSSSGPISPRLKMLCSRQYPGNNRRGAHWRSCLGDTRPAR
jgi:outer membrane protein TolC